MQLNMELLYWIVTLNIAEFLYRWVTQHPNVMFMLEFLKFLILSIPSLLCPMTLLRGFIVIITILLCQSHMRKRRSDKLLWHIFIPGRKLRKEFCSLDKWKREQPNQVSHILLLTTRKAVVDDLVKIKIVDSPQIILAEINKLLQTHFVVSTHDGFAFENSYSIKKFKCKDRDNMAFIIDYDFTESNFDLTAIRDYIVYSRNTFVNLNHIQRLSLGINVTDMLQELFNTLM